MYKERQDFRYMSTTTYKKVFGELAGAVKDGRIKSGTKVSVRGLAKQFDINKNTAHRIMQELRKHGLLEIQAGKASRLVLNVNENDAVKDASYVPAASAASGSVVLLSCDPVRKIENNFVTMELIKGFSQSVQGNGLTMEVMYAGEDDLDAVARTLVRRENILGVCLTSVHQFPLARKLRGFGVITVSLNIPSAGQTDYEILADDFEATSMAVRHLRKLGHSRIGYVGVGPESVLSRRYYGYYTKMLEYNNQAPIPADWIYFVSETGVYEESAFFVHLKQMLSKEDRPTAFVFSGDCVAFTGASAFKSLGYSVPDDLAFVSYDNSYLALESIPKWSSVSLPREKVAQEAVDVLVACANGQRPQAPHRVFLPELIVRESCGANQSMLQEV